jgi:hypothetical protein
VNDSVSAFHGFRRPGASASALRSPPARHVRWRMRSLSSGRSWRCRCAYMNAPGRSPAPGGVVEQCQAWGSSAPTRRQPKWRSVDVDEMSGLVGTSAFLTGREVIDGWRARIPASIVVGVEPDAVLAFGRRWLDSVSRRCGSGWSPKPAATRELLRPGAELGVAVLEDAGVKRRSFCGCSRPRTRSRCTPGLGVAQAPL